MWTILLFYMHRCIHFGFWRNEDLNIFNLIIVCYNGSVVVLTGLVSRGLGIPWKH